MALIALAIFSFMTSLDSSIVNIAMPIIAKEQNQTVNNVEWIVIIYLLVITSLLMFFGKLGDLVGKIKIFRIGTVIFLIGSITAGLNFGFGFLLFSRSIQALGAAMTMSNNFGITTALFPEKQRGRSLSILATAFALGSIAGPSFGGLILSIASWRYIFWINVPIGLIAIWLGQVSLPKSHRPKTKAKLDYLGTVLFAAFVSTMFFGFSRGQSIGYGQVEVLLELLVAVILLASFIIFEQKSKQPMLNFKIFKNVEFSMGVLSAILVFIVGYFYNIIIPYYLVNARNFDPGFAGLLMATIPLTIAFFGPLG
ncbi:MFS transporter [Companilactobacillus furfuricola]|uniref:MFS transporter n=1 Tax=Companilactobacillus furfuricola TaxID=1462575 RepID=UPI001FE31FF9|nr:MFS transporter [Companilactobacillus furfuricola]